MTCKRCNKPTAWKKWNSQYAVFCGKDCELAWRKEWMMGNKRAAGPSPNRHAFKKGNRPWNKNLKGIHLSPKSEFKKGESLKPPEPVGTVRIRQRKNRHDQPRAWVKVDQPNVWVPRAIYVYESHYGKLPKGMIVHHKDHDSLNDNVSNLQAVTRQQHIALHLNDLLTAKLMKRQL